MMRPHFGAAVFFYLIGISYQIKKAVLIKDDFKIVVPP